MFCIECLLTRQGSLAKAAAIFPDILIKAKSACQQSELKPQAYSTVKTPEDIERLRQLVGYGILARKKIHKCCPSGLIARTAETELCSPR